MNAIECYIITGYILRSNLLSSRAFQCMRMLVMYCSVMGGVIALFQYYNTYFIDI